MERTNSKGMEISLIAKFGDCIPFVVSIDEMSKMIEARDTDKDLLYLHCVQPVTLGAQYGVSVYVRDDVYELIGEISSSSDESELHNDERLEYYLTHTTNPIPNSQGMVRTKQTARKTDRQGLPVASQTDETVQVPTELQSDSSLEREYIETMSSRGEGSASRGSRGRSAGPASTRVAEPDRRGTKGNGRCQEIRGFRSQRRKGTGGKTGSRSGKKGFRKHRKFRRRWTTSS